MASTDSTVQNGAQGSGDFKTPAQKLMEKHDKGRVESHKATLEDTPDEDDLRHGPAPTTGAVLEGPNDSAPTWAAPMSAKAGGKQKEAAPAKENKPLLNTQSDELFPGLGGAPKPVQTAAFKPSWSANAKKPAANGASNGASTNGTSTPTSGANTPPQGSQSAQRGGPQSLAGQAGGPSFILQPKDILPRTQLKKPIPDVLKDINKKTRANLSMTTGEGGLLKFTSSGAQVPDALRRQAFRDLGAQIGVKSSANVPVPRSARAHIIGKQGSTIKQLQEATGVRIQMPKMEDAPPQADDEDDDILVMLEGNLIAILMARDSINKIASERSAAVNSKLRTIPAEFYPFIGARANALEETHGIQIRVPPHHTWTTQPPPQKPRQGQAPAFIPAAGDNRITLGGDRAAVQAARAEIERLADELRHQLILDEMRIPRGQHQYIIGDRGIPAQEFFANTGCAIILPAGDDEENITIIGPSADKVSDALDQAMTLASNVQSASFDISRLHRNVPGGVRVHARNVTQYLRDRKELDRIEKLHQTHIVTPFDAEGAAPWELYYRDGKNNLKAQSEIASIVNAHPPSRMATLPIDPFFHAHIKKDITPRVKKDYGVHVVVPDVSESSAPVLLVFEGEGGLEPEYQVPRGQPSPAEIKAFQQGLEDARKHILEIISAQAQIISTSIDVSQIFHEKLRRFIKKEQQDRAIDQIPVRVTATGTLVTLRGPEPAVEALAAKVNAFVEQAKEDEKERGFTLSFDFPQKHANQLIGKSGSNIKDLRERFDVEIKVDDGKVELKGPKAKAEAAKTHISALGRQWADEATYTLKVDPKYHRELIGAGGAQINRLQTRYKVQIHFPRSAKPLKDDQSNVDAASEAGRRGGRRDQEPDEVVVKGPKKGADEARDEILSLLQYLKDNSNVATVSVQGSQIPSLIGQRGSGMDEIRQSSGARIDIPNARDSSDLTARVEIQIKGTKDQVAKAKKLIEAKRDVFDQTVTKTLEVDKKHHRALIGTGGSALRDIVVSAGGSDDRRELARTVQFPKADADGNLIKVEGKSDIVDKIIAAMQKIVAERESQTTETIDVATDKHRSLIGRGGETKKELESKFKVSIDIPRQGSGQTSIKITGLPADVEQAKTHILDLVKDQEGETVQVPRKVHNTIADNGQFFRRLRNDHQVTVDHAGHNVPPKTAAAANARANGDSLPLITDDADAAADAFLWNVVDSSTSDIDGEIPWILRGPSENIPKAKSTLAAAIEQALKNTTTGYLVLSDPGTYRHVIGQGGSKVNSIRKATGCKITVPRNQAKDEAIEIIGTAEGVEKAKEMVLKAVRDGASGNGGNGGYGSRQSGGNGSWD